ncbi:hypothetical protein BUALT_Bualt17G0046300 [Buddleja alternifolia]|uniref:Protein FAR1-RELATED SEQUENCE n=1 Tax=Buddleja alternifolia TaxID=168488 RepID=A0AAV6W7P7_9LAMI|nr:hypothetical protein BUALT_Bualt17G0046300 [Buddleja alternifolia]
MDKVTSIHDLTPRCKLAFEFDEEKEEELLGNGGSERLINEHHSTISEEKIPKIGVEFDDEKTTYTFYNEYAKVVGFNIRKHVLRRDNKGTIIDRIFCCACQGHRQKDKRDVNVKSHRLETRNGCFAMMRIDGRCTGKYKVVSFVASHNGHDLVSPAKTHFFRSHRSIAAALTSQANDFDNSGIAPRAGFTLMAKQVGGRGTGGVLEYLQQRQLDDPNFFYAIQVDEDDLIANILWVDAQMMADYAHFGDVVSFDTTYRKNKEDLTTTQRSESMNSVLKRYVSYKHNLLQFFRHLDKLVDDRRHEELKAYLRSIQSKPVASFPVEILKHAATLEKLLSIKLPLLESIVKNTVMYDSSEGKVSCSCKKIEFAGILCSHALKVLSLTNIIRIPELYIKKRWTKKAKNIVREQAVEVDTERSTSMDEKEERKMIGVHYKELCGLSNQLVTRASMTMETYRIAKVSLFKMIEEIDVSLENGADMRLTLGSKFVVQKNALDEAGKKSSETAIRGWKNKEKKPNVNSAKNCPGIDASFDSSSYSSSSQLSQEIQRGSNSVVAYPLSHVQPFQVAQTFNPIVHQHLNLSPYYSRQDEQNGMSLTELLQQQLVKTQGVERFQWNSSTNESDHEKINEERGDVPKG